MLLIPVNIPNYHWMLLEINFQDQHITIHDSAHYDVVEHGLDKNINVVYDQEISNKIFNSNSNLDGMNQICTTLGLIVCHNMSHTMLHNNLKNRDEMLSHKMF